MGTDRFILGTPELVSIRFAIAPGIEGTRAVRRLTARQSVPLHRALIERIRRDTPAECLRILAPLAGGRGYTPDFLAQPEATTPDRLLTATRGTSLDIIDAELRQAAGEGRRIPANWLADPELARTQIAHAWEMFWDLGMHAHWPRMRSVLESDIATRARSLAHRGLEAVVEDLDPRLHWHETALLRTDSRFAVETDCRGRGLRLVPTVLGWPHGAITTDPPWTPTIYYPARNAATTTHQDPARTTAALIGTTRARILDHLRVPARTTDIASALDISPATASHHLHILNKTGLVITQRRGKEAWHSRSSVTDQLRW
ncbi:DUF5937 family protein [Dermacoccus sp. Ellin185]|uniref:ArsR/SmtB family transcription factor n=1 Tax=Dermacoccus sp. Ellin185 TaxID=188626 RepID=UPI0001E63D98|nr:DUF5937 family protein [Dermacoccus sp. Ellin185]EFP59378.1 transcriptional regulator, ArsR family [Dermacoccus sp. Ellin185]